MVYKNNKYTLLDGAHRIVASYIKNIYIHILYNLKFFTNNLIYS